MALNDELKIKEIISETLNSIIIFDEEPEAKNLIKAIRALIKKNNYQDSNKELYDYYQDIIIKLKWVAFSTSGVDEVVNLFNSNFQIALDFKFDEFDLKAKMKKLLLGFDYQERDKIKAEIVQILNKSQALLTHNGLLGGLRPTVENWIKIYIAFVGNYFDSLKSNQFFIENKDYLKLSQEEKIKVRAFFKFFEKIKKSSFTAEGIEDSVPVNTPEFKGLLIDGELVKGELSKDLLEIYQAVVELNKNSRGETAENLDTDKVDIDKRIDDKVDEIISTRRQYGDKGLEKMALNEEVEGIKKIDDLRAMAGKFKDGSLEKRAIEEEIRKLS